jgi:hypothetical protein
MALLKKNKSGQSGVPVNLCRGNWISHSKAGRLVAWNYGILTKACLHVSRQPVLRRANGKEKVSKSHGQALETRRMNHLETAGHNI